MTILRTAVLATLAAGAAFTGQASAASSALVSVAHPAYMRQGAAVMGNLPVAQPIHFLMSLKMRDPDGLNAYIADMKNHPGKVMSTAEFMAKHAPTQAQVDAVTGFLQAQGFTRIEVRPNHLLISAWGNAGSVNKAFNTRMVQVRTGDGRIAYGNATDALIPATLESQVLGVVGLQTVNMGHTLSSPVKPRQGSHTMAVTAYLPTDFPTIYGATGVATGAGVAVGIFTQGSMATTISDLNKFTAAHGYPTVTTQQVNTDGTGTSTSGTDEWDLDSQDIVGMAGGQVGKIIWYQTPSLSDADMDDNFNTIVTANAAKIVNVSIGGCETSASGATATASDQSFAQGVAQGQTFSISTGSAGADECGDGGSTPSWPANSQYVVAVAGTTVTAGTGDAWQSEVVWPAGGGTESRYETKPTWQPATCAMPCKFDGKFRAVGDVAFDANPGVELYLNGASPSASTAISGTSLSTALFSGEWARVIATKGASVGFAAPILYQLPAAAFHDITSGTDTNGSETAAVGWDVASGRGSINLSAALANWPGDGGPVANFTDTVSGLTASFIDTSNDSGGTIVAHAWTFGDGGTSTATNPTHTYALAGTYPATETVTDGGGSTATVTRSVLVEPHGGMPTANWTDTTSGLTATFTDTSTDPGGTITGHSWSFGDGSTSTAASPSHTYPASGTYSVTETVIDGGSGISSSKTAPLTLSSTSSQLLGNSGFESGVATPWTMTSGALCSNSNCPGEAAHAGTWFAWFDGYGAAHTDTVSQKVTLPAGKTTATLKYYLHIDTAETSTTAKDDTLTVAMYNGTTLLKTLATYSNLNKNTGYTVHNNDVSAYIGQAVTVKFTGKENSSLQTSFVLDDITLTVQ